MRREKNEQSSKTLNTLHNTEKHQPLYLLSFHYVPVLCYFKTIDPSIAAVEPGFHLFHIPSLKCTQKVICYIKNDKPKQYPGVQPTR